MTEDIEQAFNRALNAVPIPNQNKRELLRLFNIALATPKKRKEVKNG